MLLAGPMVCAQPQPPSCREKLEACPPLLPEGVQNSDPAWERVHIKYVANGALLRQGGQMSIPPRPLFNTRDVQYFPAICAVACCSGMLRRAMPCHIACAGRQSLCHATDFLRKLCHAALCHVVHALPRGMLWHFMPFHAMLHHAMSVSDAISHSCTCIHVPCRLRAAAIRVAHTCAAKRAARRAASGRPACAGRWGRHGMCAMVQPECGAESPAFMLL